MGISQLSLGRLFLYALVLGVILGIVYDLTRLTRLFFGAHYNRRVAKHLRRIELPFLPLQKEKGESRALGIVLFFEDLLFCLGVGIALILLFYEVHNGKVRGPAILCCGAGFLIYRFTLGRLVMLSFEFVAYFLETAVRYAVFFISWPIRVVKRQIVKCVVKFYDGAKKRYLKRGRARYTACQQKRIAEDGGGMFPGFLDSGRTVMKKGRKYARKEKETVQPEPAFSRFFGSHRSHIHHGVRKQRDEI